MNRTGADGRQHWSGIGSRILHGLEEMLKNLSGELRKSRVTGNCLVSR
jgi:hypothetical protein